jgi:hypothetical protein
MLETTAGSSHCLILILTALLTGIARENIFIFLHRGPLAKQNVTGTISWMGCSDRRQVRRFEVVSKVQFASESLKHNLMNEVMTTRWAVVGARFVSSGLLICPLKLASMPSSALQLVTNRWYTRTLLGLQSLN